MADKVEEAVKITVEEDERERIVDIFKSITLVGTTETFFVSEPINGYLEGIFLTSNKNIDIEIVLEEYQDLVIHKDVSHFGTKFIPFRVQPVVNNERINFSYDKLALNNRLRFMIKGVVGTTTDIIIRYS